MKNAKTARPEWVDRGKSIRQLIRELQFFDDQDLEVRLSLDAGDSHQPVSLVGKSNGYCVLASYLSFYDEKSG